jgi:hypothetical protein
MECADKKGAKILKNGEKNGTWQTFDFYLVMSKVD